MRHRSIAAVILLGVAVLASGCSSGADGGGSAGGVTDPQSFVDQLADIHCVGVKPCCEQAGSEHDIDACKSFFQAFGEHAMTAKNFDPKAAEQCLALTQAEVASCSSGGTGDTICDRVFSGDVPLGGSCKDSIDCAALPDGEVFCDADFESGTCKRLLPAEEGKACGAVSETEYQQCEAEAGYYCNFETNLCTKRGEVGAACGGFGSFECVDEARCDFQSGQCVARAEIGQPCTFELDCVGAAYCSDAGTCAAKKKFGEACADGLECQALVCEQGICRGDSTGMCVWTM